MAVNSATVIAFDLDGTLYVEDRLIEGAAEAVAAAHAAGLVVLYMTNSSGRTRAEIADKLTALGVPAEASQVYTSAAAAGRWLAENGIGAVWVSGAQGLIAEIEAYGGRVTRDEDEAEAVVVGLDRSARPGDGEGPLSHRIAQLVRQRRCLMLACNRDLTFPGRDGAVHPGCGEVVDRAEALCGRSADVVVGKPEPYMLEAAARDHRVRVDQVLVVGDSWTSDVAMARRCGSPWAFVPAPGQPTALGQPTAPGQPAGLGQAAPAPGEHEGDPKGATLRSIAELPSLLAGGRGRLMSSSVREKGP